MPKSVVKVPMSKFSSKPLIVIVDDEDMITNSLSAMLSLDGNFEILAFNQPTTVIDELTRLNKIPDLIISDYLMPQMNGIAFLKSVRPHFPESTFILLTGYADKENAIAAINEVGLYKYIEKPWDNDDLKLTINNGIERTRLRLQLQERVEELETARAELVQHNQDLDQKVQDRTAELSEALASLKEIDRMREDFIATLTHDMRTPLLASLQTLKLMQEGSIGELNERQQEITGLLIQNQDDLLTLVNTLLDIYRYEANQQKLVLETIELDQLSQDVIRSLEPLANEREQILQMLPKQNETVYSIRGDRFALKRVLTNLVSNAIRYTPTGGNIKVSIEAQNNQIVWVVEDNGRGIPEVDLQKLFQRFAQGTSKHRTTGSGLGLYLSRKIIEAHAGEIFVESQEGQGSRFYFNLPKL